MDQWSKIPDIEENDINFTDGVGTISPGLAELIFTALCEDNPSLLVNSIPPSAVSVTPSTAGGPHSIFG